MEQKLQGKVALVTGAGGLLGRSIVRRLADAGAMVVATDLSLAKIAPLLSEIAQSGGNAISEKLDITDSAEVASVFKRVEQRMGRIDLLVNNAGVVREKAEAFQQTDETYWKKLIEVNLFGTMICTQRVLPGMIARKNEKIINIASIAGVSGLPGWADYAASKGGVILFSQTLAMELGGYGITVNCISPGMIGVKLRADRGTWLGRCGTPDDIAGAIVFLGSSDGDYITGTNFLVDGGRVLGPKNASWNS